jgi:hypothetical protein
MPEVILQGKCKWAHVRKPGKFGDWTIDLYPNEESLTKVKTLIEEGIKNQLKKDDDGYYIRFKRPLTIQLKNGQRSPLEPPQVLNKDRTICTDNIGNGSDVTILLETYGGKAPMGAGTYKAARLKGVKVETLVPYTVDSIDGEYDGKKARSLADAPLQEAW